MRVTHAYRKIPACLPRTLYRKLKRLASARHHQLEQTNWAAIVFTGEKKINLDRPDGFQKTWLERVADVPDVWSWCGPNMTFQRDNAQVHRGRLVQNFMNDENVQFLDWPAYPPDFNIIEDVWGILACKVYDGARHCQTVLELKNAFLLARETLDPPVLANSYVSLPKRIFDCAYLLGAYVYGNRDRFRFCKAEEWPGVRRVPYPF
ncbi:Transposable element Tc3 transposase [Porphyridium purpureum]|uniref:Transposable element Tc3 transposase n=1 Tax=Porphyridium purpureum TaxID=35688 RepID=A0A5J4Z4P7_PORPP|nr:Transposable element Tc3 transposase [Porphyridium purpureum]|eukprot:POR4222..scf295_1